MTSYDDWKTTEPDAGMRDPQECIECKEPLPIDDDGDVMLCQTCDICFHCGLELSPWDKKGYREVKYCTKNGTLYRLCYECEGKED